MHKLFALTTVLISTNVSLAARDTIVSDSLLQAIRQVETSNQKSPPRGDNGKAIGSLQIHKAYFDDAKEFDKSITFSYEEIETSYEKSCMVVRAYMKRYAPSGATAEQIALLHNGGCGILKKAGSPAHRNALRYWEKVRKHLTKS